MLDYHLSQKQKDVLEFCSKEEKSRAEIFEFLEMANSTLNSKKHIVPLIENELLQMTEPNKPKSKNQKYYTTEFGQSQIH